MASCPPVVLVCYNRAELTRQVLEAVRQASPSELFLVADGPRPRDPVDAERCQAVRDALEEIDWPCAVHRLYQDTNRGCETTVELGLDWVFDHVTEAVVLEDDCIPDASFFRFCAEMLDRHAGDEQVMMISGTHFAIDAQHFGRASYAYTTFSITWGWATWRRAWSRHRKLFPRDHVTPSPGTDDPEAAYRVGPRTPVGLVTRAGRRYFREVSRARLHEFGWDSQWFLSQAISDALAVAPAVNMVRNAGFGNDATHTRSSRTMPPAESMQFPLHHPQLSRNIAAQRDLELGMVRTNGRLARTVRRFVPQGRLRDLARAAADWVVRPRRAR